MPWVHTTVVPRVEKQPDAVNNRATRAAALLMEHTKKLKQRHKEKAAARVVSADAPARNTQHAFKEKKSAAKKAVRVQPASKGPHESTKKKTRQSRLMKSTALSREISTKGSSVGSSTNQLGKELSATKQMQRLENKVNAQPKIQKKWATSSANKFGQLANIQGRKTHKESY